MVGGPLGDVLRLALRPYTLGFAHLADGFVGVLFGTRGDVDFVSDTLKLLSWSAVGACCNLRRANRTNLNFTDVRRAVASWLSTIWTNASLALHNPERHRIFRHVPGSGILCYILDVLHCKHLGTDPMYYGSVMRILTHHMGGNPCDNLS